MDRNSAAGSLPPGSLAGSGDIYLRARAPSDLALFLAWAGSGSWRQWDAPWETSGPGYLADYPGKFAASLERESQGGPLRALICLRDGRCIGQLTRYGERDPRLATMVGIDICVDEAMGKGYGSRALSLWVGYLFAEMKYHRIGLETWSYNERMIHVAKKSGFRAEGIIRELQFWNGTWQDRHLYGLLRHEWLESGGARA